MEGRYDRKKENMAQNLVTTSRHVSWIDSGRLNVISQSV
ncbi:hypothetical protein PEC301619_07240 [Pectobacterium carotovorum subsp. carotovorum]|nr:hypothetical protein PEC301619_07240 [Pectobacterium carotovorum subsp. carotovorum]